MYFCKIELQASAIPLFHQILTEKIILNIVLMIQVHLQGQKVNFKVKLLKMSFLTNIIGNNYIIILGEWLQLTSIKVK